MPCGMCSTRRCVVQESNSFYISKRARDARFLFLVNEKQSQKHVEKAGKNHRAEKPEKPG